MDDSAWAAVKAYGSQLEADIDVGILSENGIPHRVEGPPVGIFGPGFAGGTAAGVRVLVPREQLEAARELIGDDVA